MLLSGCRLAGGNMCRRPPSTPVCAKTFAYLRSVLSTECRYGRPRTRSGELVRASHMTTVAQGAFRRFVQQVDVT